MLTIDRLTTSFNGVAVVQDVSLSIKTGCSAALLGLNGAGKSMCLRAAAGLVPSADGVVILDDRRIDLLPAEERAAIGLAFVSQKRSLFADLTVDENLRAGCYRSRRRVSYLAARDEILDRFPELASRLSQKSQTLSGGEATMLAIARALLMRPRALLIDEPSAALAPAARRRLAEVLRTVVEGGAALLLAEQNVAFAVDLVDDVHVLTRGRLAYSAATDGLDPAALTQVLR